MTITETRKRQKLNLIFNTIREHPNYTKTEVKNCSGLSMESAMQYVDELIKAGYIYISGTKGAKVGRKGECLMVKPDGAYFIGIKFTDLSVNSMLVSLGGEILAAEEFMVSEGIANYEILMGYMYRSIDMLIDGLTVDQRAKIKAIGIAAPGFVDTELGVVRQYFNINAKDNIKMRDLLEKKYGISTYIEHTVKTKAISYRLLPKNRQINDFIYILVGSGVAMATMIDGKLYRSVNNNDGEIGHIIVVPNGKKCTCGKQGCLETVAGNEAIIQRIKAGIEKGEFCYFSRLGNKKITIDDFIEAINAGDKDSILLVDRIAGYIAEVVASAVIVLGPPKIIFCGEYILAEAFQKSFRSHLQSLCLHEVYSKLNIEYLRNNKKTDAYDAAQLGFYKQFYNTKLT